MSTNNLILDRIQRLICLGLEGQPAAELIAGTAQIWQEKLGRYDERRLIVAFDSVEGTARRWPTPADVIAALPVYAHTYTETAAPQPGVPQIATDPEAAQRSKERIDGVIAVCAKNLGVILP